jgi:ABC-type lipoprotein export system ATPase subunit/bifunctional DNA-binding transcriptional regulator/antitoxin component of YhaV-PrlF toxin-antitoxin module
MMGGERAVQESAMIYCDNLVKIYEVAEHDVMALQGLDLIVQTGELMGIVGVSGSGKTTLLNILGGLDRPSAGRIWVNGQNMLKLSNAALDRYRLNTVGFVWQQSARNLIPYMTALKNIEMPMTLAGENGRIKRRRAEELLDMVGLADRRDHKLSELSGGEQQRVAMAVALVNRPKLLLADEPTGEVDEANAEMIYQIIKDLNQELKLTTMIVSHDFRLTQHVDRVVAIRDGKVATETLRQSRAAQSEISDDDLDDDYSYTELIVLDSAGRLQIPEELKEQFGIKRRVQLEVVDEGILIRPTAGQETLHEDVQETTPEPEIDQKGNRLGELFKRWLPNRERRS